MQRPSFAAYLTIALATQVSLAAADPPRVAAIAVAGDVRKATLLGPAGQVYEPDGKGAWLRHHAGGISEEIATVARVGTAILAGAKAGPPFKLVAGAWTLVYLAQHAKALVGGGTRAVAAVGKTVFALDRAQPAKLADAPGVVTALGASASGVVVETDRGLTRLEGKAWKAIKGAPRNVVALLDDHWAIVDRGFYDLRAGKAIPLPAGLHIAAAAVVADDLVVAATSHGAAVELVTVRAGKLDREPVKLDHASPVVAIAGDRQGRVLLATRDGQIVLRDGGTWSTGELRDDLPPSHPGAPPATQQ